MRSNVCRRSTVNEQFRPSVGPTICQSQKSKCFCEVARVGCVAARGCVAFWCVMPLIVKVDGDGCGEMCMCACG